MLNFLSTSHYKLPKKSEQTTKRLEKKFNAAHVYWCSAFNNTHCPEPKVTVARKNIPRCHEKAVVAPDNMIMTHYSDVEVERQRVLRLMDFYST